jgi:hypothetical protein
MAYYEANGWISHVQGSAASGRQDLRNWLGQQLHPGCLRLLRHITTRNELPGI